MFYVTSSSASRTSERHLTTCTGTRQTQHLGIDNYFLILPNSSVCFGCLFLRSPSQIPYRTELIPRAPNGPSSRIQSCRGRALDLACGNFGRLLVVYRIPTRKECVSIYFQVFFVFFPHKLDEAILLSSTRSKLQGTSIKPPNREQDHQRQKDLAGLDRLHHRDRAVCKSLLERRASVQ